MKVIVFRNKNGDLGFFQKKKSRVFYLINCASNFDYIDGTGDWSTWNLNNLIKEQDGGQVDNENITAETISYFLKYRSVVNRDIADLHEAKYPGAYYPRVRREEVEFNYISPSFLQDMRAYQNIQSSLDDLFNFIEPVKLNLSTYGHKIRELIILACTEVEYLLLKVLTENGYEEKGRYNTHDYICCRDVLKLNQYEVSLVQYSNLGVFTPFKDWVKDSPTGSIAWYAAYNQVKHNRSDNIVNANLEHLLDAVSAIHILLEAQYGSRIFDNFLRSKDSSLFKTIKRPIWNLNEVAAPILEIEESLIVKPKWLEARKYFKDHPFK